jgi:hypothetical protein
MSRGGWDEVVSLGTGTPLDASVAEAAMVLAMVFGRFARGELGREGGTWLELLVTGGGVAALVMTRLV